ncbi:MAG: methyltransferase domain-containing protein [Myxococcota bacterium]
MSRTVEWDPATYERFRAERAQPFHDLVAAIPEIVVRFAVDLGCGSGELTCTLLERWPGARILGIDSSPEMLANRAAAPTGGNPEFAVADLRTFMPRHPCDLVLSNAALQWVGDHATLMGRMARMLAPGGVLAVQLPNNRFEAATQITDELADESPWCDLGSGSRAFPRIESVDFYVERLAAEGLTAEVFEKVYEHRLPNAAAIVDWLEGTYLRPVLGALGEAEMASFRALLVARLEAAYPAAADGVVFPFRRLFFVARRPAVNRAKRGTVRRP